MPKKILGVAIVGYSIFLLAIALLTLASDHCRHSREHFIGDWQRITAPPTWPMATTPCAEEQPNRANDPVSIGSTAPPAHNTITLTLDLDTLARNMLDQTGRIQKRLERIENLLGAALTLEEELPKLLEASPQEPAESAASVPWTLEWNPPAGTLDALNRLQDLVPSEMPELPTLDWHDIEPVPYGLPGQSGRATERQNSRAAALRL